MRGARFDVVLFLAGVIGSEPEPEPIESTFESVNAAGVFGAGRKKVNRTEYPSSPEPPRSTVPPNPPTTDENLIYGKAFATVSV